ncbi:MAG: hypothetical protein QM775_25330 [Pirellulales bacterium]
MNEKKVVTTLALGEGTGRHRLRSSTFRRLQGNHFAGRSIFSRRK